MSYVATAADLNRRLGVESYHLTLAILTRNRPNCLRTALEAALGGIDRPDDILVSDDSDDSFRAGNRQLVARNDGVRYTEGPRRGLGANENHIVANLAPQTDWVVFIGDDARLSMDYVLRLRQLLERHGPERRIPTGVELRNGVLVRPNRLDFLGFQSRPYKDYTPGSMVETVVVQATAFPHELLRQVSWLEVSPYGYDEVDMAKKASRLGWSFVFEPSLCVYHDQSSIGRDRYPTSAQLARLYFRLRSYSVYGFRPAMLAAYMVIAPLHLVAAHIRRRNWRQLAQVPRVTFAAYMKWLRSLAGDWRRT
jgi:GT2 family glycosyltransferase